MSDFPILDTYDADWSANPHSRTKMTCKQCRVEFSIPTARSSAGYCSRPCALRARHQRGDRPTSRYTPEQQADMVRRIRAGETKKALADEYGMAKSQMTYLMKKHGL